MEREVVSNSRYKVLTTQGFKNFDGYSISNQKTMTLWFQDKFLVCTPDHKLFCLDIDAWIEAQELNIGNALRSVNGAMYVTNIEKNEEVQEVVDLLNVEDTHSFIANDVDVHNCIIVDEMAHVGSGGSENTWEEFWASVQPTISSGNETKMIGVSTPRGMNFFFSFVENARKENSDWTLIEVTWKDVPGRDEKWKQETLASINYDEQLFAQEYDCEFQGSSGSLIASWKLKELVSQNPSERELNTQHRFHTFQKPQQNRNYAIIADVSEGKGLDYCAAQVLDVTEMPYQQVAVFHSNKINPIDFAERLHRLGHYYHIAPILVENNFGKECLSVLHYDLEYESIIWTKSSKGAAGGREVSGGFASSGTTEMGVRTTKSTKKSGCSILKMLIEQNQLILNDQPTIVELSQFVKKGDSYEADNGGHDDLVMCLVLFGWMSSQSYFSELTDTNTLKNLSQDNEDDLMEDVPAFGVFDDGIEHSGSTETLYTI